METSKAFTYEEPKRELTIDSAPKDPVATADNMAKRAILLSDGETTPNSDQITEWPVDEVTNGNSEIFFDKNSGSALPKAPHIDHVDVL